MNIVHILFLLALLASAVLALRNPREPLGAIRLLRDVRGIVDYNLVSRDAQRALEEFSEAFAMALAQAPTEQWAKELGFYFSSRALKTTYPIPFGAAGYAEFKGDMKYRTLLEKSLTLKPKTWQDGVSELASVVEAPDFIGWGTEPQRIALAGDALLNEIVATLLEANGTLGIYEDTALSAYTFFDDAHPFNLFDTGLGTFDNDITGSGTNSTTANLVLAKQRFREIKAANGKPLGLKMTHVMVPPALEETWRDLLERDLIVESSAAVDNRHKGTVKIVVNDQLTDDNQWYPLALNKPGLFPWVVQDEGGPEEIRSDKDSPLYKSQLKVGVAYVKRANAALALPHCIQRWAGTAP